MLLKAQRLDKRRPLPADIFPLLTIDPLRARVRANGGRVYRGGPEFSLLIDMKTGWARTHPALRSMLTNYLELLTTVSVGAGNTASGGTSTVIFNNAVLIVVLGSHSREMFAGETWRVSTAN